ncbi:peptidylprolyl isomerase [Clostridiaceae bacterium HFYG-1003]|nr:peptidylprolyl isomerase [Clostridiaceae bacterium HFYG-1003]
MKRIKQLVSMALILGALAGCAPSPASPSNTSVPGSNAGQTTAAQSQAASTTTTMPAVITKAIDPSIILAEGEGISITSGQVEEEFNKMLDSLRAQYTSEMVDGALATLQQQKPSILDQLVRNALLLKKADEMKIASDSAEALAKYEQIMKDNLASYGGQEQFDQILKNAGFTAESYKAEVLKSLRFKKVAEELTKDIQVTDAEINETYEEEKATNYTQSAGATIYHIFFGEPDSADAEAKAKEAKAKLDKGAKFEDLAKEYGKDGTATQGGLLGNYPYENQELSPDFMAEAKKLKEGEISAPVKTSFGWHLIKVTNVVAEPKVLALTDMLPLENGKEITVKENVRMNILNEKKQARLEELLKEWETAYDVKKYPEKIPMNVDVPAEPDAGSTTPDATGSTTPAATTK